VRLSLLKPSAINAVNQNENHARKLLENPLPNHPRRHSRESSPQDGFAVVNFRGNDRMAMIAPTIKALIRERSAEVLNQKRGTFPCILRPFRRPPPKISGDLATNCRAHDLQIRR